MKTETLALLLLSSIAHALLFYACGTEERLCMTAHCNPGHEIEAAREAEGEE